MTTMSEDDYNRAKQKKSREMGGAYHMLCCYDYVDFGIKFQDEMMIPHTNLGGLGSNKMDISSFGLSLKNKDHFYLISKNYVHSIIFDSTLQIYTIS